MSQPPLPAAAIGRRGYLLLRRGGGVWGIANAQVTSLAREERSERDGRSERSGRDGGDGRGRAAAYRVDTEAEPLAADEILGVTAELDVRRPARAVARWWPAGSDGCALWSGLPVVLVDPRHPPDALRVSADATGETAGEPAGARSERSEGEPGGEPNDGD